MSIIHGDCIAVMAGMEPDTFDAIVTDPPYGISFMAKERDAPGAIGDFPMRRSKATNTVNTGVSRQGGRQQQGLGFQKRQARDARSYQESSEAWAREAYRVAKPSAYLLAFGGTRTVHRMVAGIEDAGWIIRDLLVWGYASGFPKSKASLKPAWEPIVMARKPGPLRMLAIDACRIPGEAQRWTETRGMGFSGGTDHGPVASEATDGRWPANIVLTDPIFDGDVDEVVGGGWQESNAVAGSWAPRGAFPIHNPTPTIYGDAGTYSRFFLIPKAARADREPVAYMSGADREGPLDDLSSRFRTKTARQNTHPTVKPTDLMRHLVRLVTPTGGTVLDPFLGSGTTGLAAEMEGFVWVGIEREAEYVAIAEARLNGTQRGLGLETA